MRDIDIIIARLTSAHPALSAEQLRVGHPGADDDGLWFFRHPDSSNQVQLESSTGSCPFLFESDADNQRLSAATVADAITFVARGLGLNAPAA